MPMDEKLEEILQYHRNAQPGSQEDTLALLREIQDLYGYLPLPAQEKAAGLLGVKPTYIAALIKRIPSLKGDVCRHRIVVCTGPRCLAKKGFEVLRRVEKTLGIEPGQITADGRFRLDTQNCMKNCGTSPNMRIDGDLYTAVDPETVEALLEKYP